MIAERSDKLWRWIVAVLLILFIVRTETRMYVFEREMREHLRWSQQTSQEIKEMIRDLGDKLEDKR